MITFPSSNIGLPKRKLLVFHSCDSSRSQLINGSDFLGNKRWSVISATQPIHAWYISVHLPNVGKCTVHGWYGAPTLYPTNFSTKIRKIRFFFSKLQELRKIILADRDQTPWDMDLIWDIPSCFICTLWKLYWKKSHGFTIPTLFSLQKNTLNILWSAWGSFSSTFRLVVGHPPQIR